MTMCTVCRARSDRSTMRPRSAWWSQLLRGTTVSIGGLDRLTGLATSDVFFEARTDHQELYEAQVGQIVVSLDRLTLN